MLPAASEVRLARAWFRWRRATLWVWGMQVIGLVVMIPLMFLAWALTQAGAALDRLPPYWLSVVRASRCLEDIRRHRYQERLAFERWEDVG